MFSYKRYLKEEEDILSSAFLKFKGRVPGPWGFHGPWGFLSGSVVKNLPANAEDASLIPELGRTPGEGNGNPLQYSCLGNLISKGA